MKSSVKVGVIFPSRGLVFSETADELLQNLKGIPHKIFFSHGVPIPDCFEQPVNKALKDNTITHLWFVEDDMILRPNTLKNLLAEDVNSVACDYPGTKDGKGTIFFDKGGRVIYTGTGCLLIKKDVFLHLKKPYFTDTIRWSALNYGESIKLIGTKVEDGTGYGLHDVTFSIKLWNAGVITKASKIKLGQRKLIALGKAGTNDGAHQIEKWRKIRKNARLNDILNQPIALGARTKLVTLDTPTGAITTSQKHAENLVAQGLAEHPPRRFTIIDDMDIDI